MSHLTRASVALILIVAALGCGSEASSSDDVFEARNGLFSCQFPSGAELQEIYEDDAFAVAFSDSFGHLYRIDGQSVESDPLVDGMDREDTLRSTFRDYTLELIKVAVPETEILSDSWMADVRGGALLVAVAMPGGSTLSESRDGGPFSRLDAKRAVLLFLENQWLFQVSVQLPPPLATGAREDPEKDLERLTEMTLDFLDTLKINARSSSAVIDAARRPTSDEDPSDRGSSTSYPRMSVAPDGFKLVKFDDALKDMIIRSMPLTLAFPEDYEVFANEPAFGKWLWTTPESNDILQQTGSSPYDEGLFLSYLTTMIGYDRNSDSFICGPDCGEEEIISQMEEGGVADVVANRHTVNGIPIWIVEATFPESPQNPLLRLRFAYIGALIDTNVVMISYRPPSDSPDQGSAVWEVFLAALLGG